MSAYEFYYSNALVIVSTVIKHCCCGLGPKTPTLFSHPPKRRRVTYASTIRPAIYQYIDLTYFQ